MNELSAIISFTIHHKNDDDQVRLEFKPKDQQEAKSYLELAVAMRNGALAAGYLVGPIEEERVTKVIYE